MKICPKCKKQYDENQKFCKICGTALVEEKKKNRVGLYILIAILAIAVCAGAVVTGMVIQNKKQEAQQQEELVSKTEECKDEKKEESDKSSTKKEESEELEKKKSEQEKTEDENKKEEEKKKEEEEQKELWKKYEEQEAKEAEEAKKEAEEVSQSNAETSTSSNQTTDTTTKPNQTTSTWDAQGQTQEEMIQHIRDVYYDTQGKLNNYNKDESTSGLAIYTENGNLKKIVSQNGACSGNLSDLPQDYSAEFYYENNTLLFAFVYKGQEEYRFYMSPNDETKCIRYIGSDGNTQDFETPVSSVGLGQGVGNLCEAGYMEPYWLGKK